MQIFYVGYECSVLFGERIIQIMNINSGNVKRLIEIFTKLNDERQHKLMQEAIHLQFEQGQENIAIKRGEKIDANELASRTTERISKASELVELLGKMDKEQQAAIGIFMNELTKGEFAKDEEIQIQINSRNMTIEEYLNKYIPGVDVDKAKVILNEIKEKA